VCLFYALFITWFSHSCDSARFILSPEETHGSAPEMWCIWNVPQTMLDVQHNIVVTCD
jgi:hypothetical protein